MIGNLGLVAVLALGIGGAQDKDIVETAKGAGIFNTLLTAATKADLVDTLKGPGPLTVFAPTDDAFAKVPKDTLDALLKDKAKLKEVLLYHVVKGKVTSGEVVKLNSANTVQGKPVAVEVKGGKVMIGKAQVIKADVAASNGVIHVIDTVLLPPAN